ncbi:MAG: SPFH domain / Band 7 family protein [bacterium ADurb.Bin425]|nr:MAG: SPFH domain / Band 7 family protein [bacterium ADurb.Bin425]
MALFVNEGNVADVFSPGRYELSTKTLPVLTSLLNWDKAFKSPFKSEVYFFSTREQLDQRWGTQQAITVRDKEFGVIRLRAFGTFAYRVEEPTTFHQKVSGTREKYTTSELDGQLRSIITTNIATTLGEAKTTFLDMAANQTKLSETLKESLDHAFWDYGLKLTSFLVQSVTLPEELQQYLDKQSSMNLVGDLKKYAQFQAADAISAAAENPGGMAMLGVGLNANALVGQAFNQGLAGSDSAAAAKPEDPFLVLEKLQTLMEKGVLSKEEFEAKKAEVLKRIS